MSEKSPAERLLNKLREKHLSPNIKYPYSLRTALLDFYDHLCRVIKNHVIRNYDDSFLIGAVFKNSMQIRNKEVSSYFKAQLTVGRKSLKRIIEYIDRFEGKLNYHTIIKYKDQLREYVFDLKEPIEYFEQKHNPQYKMFIGYKIDNKLSFELFNASNAFILKPFRTIDNLSYHESLLASSFFLRQSLEIKFKRALGIFNIYDKNRNSVKLRHEFIPNFISKNLKYFETNLPDINIQHILKIYKWTNISIHNAIVPKIFLLEYGIHLASKIFQPGKFKDDDDKIIFSIYANFKIKDYQEMLQKLCEAIYKKNGQKIFCLDMSKPESIIFDH